MSNTFEQPYTPPALAGSKITIEQIKQASLALRGTALDRIVARELAYTAGGFFNTNQTVTTSLGHDLLDFPYYQALAPDNKDFDNEWLGVPSPYHANELWIDNKLVKKWKDYAYQEVINRHQQAATIQAPEPEATPPPPAADHPIVVVDKTPSQPKRRRVGNISDEFDE
jgi:hypothetical protein